MWRGERMKDQIIMRCWMDMACLTIANLLEDANDPSRYADVVLTVKDDFFNTLVEMTGGKYTKEIKVEIAKRLSKHTPDSVQLWVIDCFDYPEDFWDAMIPLMPLYRRERLQAMYKVYCDWCDDHDYKPESITALKSGIYAYDPGKELI